MSRHLRCDVCHEEIRGDQPRLIVCPALARGEIVVEMDEDLDICTRCVNSHAVLRHWYEALTSDT